jgi:hypothetical protein
MSFFVFLESDALDKKFGVAAKRARGEEVQDDDGNTIYPPFRAVRRPYRGIQIKDDTYSTLSIIDGNGRPIPLISSSAVGERADAAGGFRGVVNDYADYIIQRIDDQRVEKQSIIETFGDSFIFFFGERPRMVTFSGVLINTEDFNWRSQFWYNYDKYLRGTKLVQRNARAFLAYDSIVVEGYPINAQAVEESEAPYHVQFQMTMFVTNYADFSEIGKTQFPSPPSILGLNAANAKLQDARHGQISTTVAVREANLDASGGLFGFLREAGRFINSVASLATAGTQLIKTTLSGRVVRVPLGVAGFLSQVGVQAEGFLSGAAGALGVQGEAGAEATVLFGAGTPGRLVIPGAAKFAPVNPDIQRTGIWMNVDEYPTRSQPEFAPLPVSAYLARLNRISEQQVLYEARRVELIAQNLAAEGQSDVLTSIADIVGFTRRGFALINNVRAAFVDPEAVLLDTLGLTGVGKGLPSSAQTKAAATARAIVPSQGFDNPALNAQDVSALTSVRETTVTRSRARAATVAGRAISPPVYPIIPNPSITRKPNTE